MIKLLSVLARKNHHVQLPRHHLALGPYIRTVVTIARRGLLNDTEKIFAHTKHNLKIGTRSISSVSKPISPLLTQLERNAASTNYFHHVLYYSTKKDDCKPKECKPEKKNVCKVPPPPCPERQLPHISECKTPNLMSDCPKPECPHDKPKKDPGGYGIYLALLALAATLAALWYFLSRKKNDEEVPIIITTKPKKKKIRIPESSKDIPHEVPYLLIGGGTAAFAAFRAIKSNDPQAQVLVISNEEHLPYMRPPLSKEMWFSEDPETPKTLNFKQWNGSQRSLFYEPNDFYVSPKDLLVNPNGGVAVARGWNISHLDVINRKAFLEDGKEISYNKCLIATGSMPKQLKVFEEAPLEVIQRTAVLRTVADYQCLAERLAKAKSVAIIGGGFLGSEMACALAKRTKAEKDFKLYHMFKEGGHMAKVLPEYLSFWTTDKIKQAGVTVMPQTEVVTAVPGKNNVVLNLCNGKSVNADLVIVAVGGIPNTEMAASSDLETDPELGGYLVNTELQARSHLYVAGDAACFFDPALGRRRIEHHDNAVISGRLAGENMTGAEKPYVHQSMFWSDLGPDIGFEAIGVVCSSLPTVGVFAKTTETKETKSKDEDDNPEVVPEKCLKYLENEENAKCDKKEKEAHDEKSRVALERRKKASTAQPGEDFNKGVIFYLRNDIIVGIVLWNVFNRMSIARQVLKEQRKYDDLNEVAKLFNIHEE